MEQYKGFSIDTDTNDHNAVVTGKILQTEIAVVFRNSGQAKAYIDGVQKTTEILTKIYNEN